MRRCANCDELTPQDSAVCVNCLCRDEGWAEHIETIIRNGKGRSLRRPQSPMQLSFLEPLAVAEPFRYTLRLSAFSDSGELGFHLRQITRLVEANPHQPVQVTCNGATWGYDWDYAHDVDPERDVYLPPSLPIPSLVEVSRFIYALLHPKIPRLNVRMILPPRDHAATKFILESRLFSAIPFSMISYADYLAGGSSDPGCDDVFIPLSPVGPETGGQLSAQFHENFDRLAAAGYFKPEHRSSLRRVLMEAAENADIWGEHGQVVCFLRQEKRGAGRFGHQDRAFSPVRETHLFLHVFSLGPSLAETTGQSNEWEAAAAVARGYSARSSGGGNGMSGILRTITESAVGTAFISSGNYTLIITPDGLVREYLSAGTDYLPGVHLCAVIPLAVISQIQSNPVPAV
jgi:hypothetical protein